MSADQPGSIRPPYLQSIESSTTTQPRFSDISRPSDGQIQVERLRLTPSHTDGGREDSKDEEDESDEIPPSSPYPAETAFASIPIEPRIEPQITVVPQDASNSTDNTNTHTTDSNSTILRSLEHLRALSAASFDHETTELTVSANKEIRASTPFKNTTNNKKLTTSAFKKVRKPPINDKDTSSSAAAPSIHDRAGSLGTIHSNAGTIGTMDVREYQQYDSTANIRPHITDKKIKKSPSSQSETIKDDAASEIPELPSSMQIEPQPTEIRGNKSTDTAVTNMSTNVQGRDTTMTDLSINSRNSKNKNKGMYLDDAVVDIDNMQFDDEVDLTGRGRINSETSDGRRKSARSVRFHDASRNTFMSPRPRSGKSLELEQEQVPGFPDIEAQNRVNSLTSGAPMRFRGPARIALTNKHVTDPFVGDTEIEQWSVGDVNVWINNLEGGVSVYARNFVSNHIKGQDLLGLTDSDLYEHLGVKSLGHRQIIMQSIKELKDCVMVEINQDRFLVPPNGAVMRFEDVSVQERRQNRHNGRWELQTILGHVTGTFLPNQITAIMGDTQKSLLMKVLSGYGMKGHHHVSGHIFINGDCIDGSLVAAGLATYINGDDTYSNFTRTTVNDLVRFYVQLSGKRQQDHRDNLFNHVLRISDITYPSRTKISELKPIQYKRLMIAIDTILYDIKLVFLDKMLDGLTMIESQEMMHMLYSFSRKLDITFILSVERIRYHILNAYFDQIIVVGGVDPQKIITDCTNYYKYADLNDVEEVEEVEEEQYRYNIDIERNQRDHQTLHNDLSESATSIRFVGRPEDVMEYFRLKQVEFVQTENPIEVIFEHVMHNFELIEAELEEDYFRYRKKSNSLSPFTSNKDIENNNILTEIWIITRFVLMVGWREWSLLYSCLRIIAYCLVVGALFWDVSCNRYFLNERLLAIFVISCIPLGCVWPILDFYRLHRDYFHRLLFNGRARSSSFVISMLILSSTHAMIIGLFSFIPWLMEDLGCNDTIAFIRIGFMQFAASMVFAVLALFTSEIFAINGLRLLSVLCTASILFSGALVHAGQISNRPGTVFISFDFLKYSLEFLLFTDVDYIQVDTCKDYLQSLDDRQFYDREAIDISMIGIWFIAITASFTFTLRHELIKSIAYSSQFMIGRLSNKHGTEEIDLPSLPPTPPNEIEETSAPNTTRPRHVYTGTGLTTFGLPTPIQSSTSPHPIVPVLPLNITPLSTVASNISHATGAFTRLIENPTPRTPHQLQEHSRSDSDARFKVVSLLKQASVASTIDNYSIASPSLGPIELPFDNPGLVHRRAKSGNRNRSNPLNASNTSLQGGIASHHAHQISLSGLETIREKKSEELPAVPPSTRIRASVLAPHVKLISTRASMISHPDSNVFTPSRYSGLAAFTPLRQQSLLGRMSFSNRRRSSLNMKAQAVPRFLAISPYQSFASLPSQSSTTNIHDREENAIIRGNAATYGSSVSAVNKDEEENAINRATHSSSVSAVNIPFETERKDEEEEDEQEEEEEKEEKPIPNVVDDYADKEFEVRMKSSPLIFYNLSIVDNNKSLIFSKVSGHVIANGVSVILSTSSIDTQPLLRAIAGVYSSDLLYMEGNIIIRGSELMTETKLAQNRIIAYVPQKPVLPDLITVREIVRLAFILTADNNNNNNDKDNVSQILKTMELSQFSECIVSQLSRMDYLKVAIAYCGLRSVAGVVLIEDIFSSLNMICQKQLLRCIHRLAVVHSVSVLTTMSFLTLESIQQDHINHIILLSSAIPHGVSPIFEGRIEEALSFLAKSFSFRKYENMISELLDISCKRDSSSLNKLALFVNDLRQHNNVEMVSQSFNNNVLSVSFNNLWLEYWWLGWLYCRFVFSHKILFLIQIFKLFIYVFVVCSAFWKLPSTQSGSSSMFGAMNALLFIFIMQTPANHRLFCPLLRLGIQDWQSGKYSLNMMSTLHCWSQYILSIVLASITSLLSYWTVNFNDPTQAISYSIILFTMGFVYSAGVWDSIYFLLFACGLNENVSFAIMAHLLLYFWLFSGCFILKNSMPILFKYIGYYANPVRLTLESQYCAIILPKTFGNERGSDILAKSDYDCAIGFDLCLVFLITFILRIVGAAVLSYRYESIPLYNNGITSPFINNPNDYGIINDDDDDDDDDTDPPQIQIKSRASKDNNKTPQIRRRNSRHKGHSSVDHISNIVGSINEHHYINMDQIDDEKERSSLIQGLKNFVDNKLKKNNQDDDDDDEDESDDELVDLENEYNNKSNQQRVKYTTTNDTTNDYNTMILGTGADNDDDMLL